MQLSKYFTSKLMIINLIITYKISVIKNILFSVISLNLIAT